MDKHIENYENLSKEQLLKVIGEQQVLIEEKDRKIEEKDQKIEKQDWEIEELDQKIEKQDREIEELDRKIEEQQLSLAVANAKLASAVLTVKNLLHLLFGSKSEKNKAKARAILDGLSEEEQQLLYGLTFEKDPPPAKAERKPRGAKSKKTTHSSDTLEQRKPDQVIEVAAPEKCPKCGGETRTIGYDERRIAELIKELEVHQLMLQKRVCIECNHIYSATPEGVLYNTMASAQTVAQVMTDRINGTPDNRTAEAFGISRQTVNKWVHKGATVIGKLARHILDKVKDQNVLHVDETRMPIVEMNKLSTKTGYLVTYISGKYSPVKYVGYKATTSRSRKVLMELPLASNKPMVMMTDAYSGYCSEGNVSNARCLVHARRQFVNLQRTLGDKLKGTFVDEILELFSALFHQEKQTKDMNKDDRFEYRKNNMLPILTKMFDLLTTNLEKYKNTEIAKAIQYMLKNWEQLTLFLSYGNVPLDNNFAESALRPYVIGRKNSLFSLNFASAERIADIYTVVQSAKLNNLKVVDYLKHVLITLDKDPQANLDQLLPTDSEIQQKFKKN